MGNTDQGREVQEDGDEIVNEESPPTNDVEPIEEVE